MCLIPILAEPTGEPGIEAVRTEKSGGLPE
jgi:hypothetical protein